MELTGQNDYPDIYFLPQWGKLNEDRDQGKAETFVYNEEEGVIIYQYVKRKIVSPQSGNEYYDLITPFGFSGPCIIRYKEGRKEELLKKFDEKFREYCKKQNYITEYIRFCPWLYNKEDFEPFYTIKDNNVTFCIDLTCSDFFMDEFSSKCRNIVRRAQKNLVKIEFDFEGNSLNHFEKLYNIMAYKNKITDYYKFDYAYFKNTFDSLRGNIFIINAIYKGINISSSMFLFYGKKMHYHLSANNPEYFNLAGNSLILYEACKWGVEHKMKQLHLGGVARGKAGEALTHFKKQFTKNGTLSFYVGYRILDEDVYHRLVEEYGSKKSDYFPLYRG